MAKKEGGKDEREKGKAGTARTRIPAAAVAFCIKRFSRAPEECAAATPYPRWRHVELSPPNSGSAYPLPVAALCIRSTFFSPTAGVRGPFVFGRAQARMQLKNFEVSTGPRLPGGGVTSFMHRCSRMTISPRTHAMPRRTTSGFHRLGRHRVHHARSALRVFGESHGG